MAARGARGALRGPEGWRLSIRNWLSKRREYSRSAPETESGVGPMDSVFTKCDRCGQPIYEKDLRARFNVCPNCEFHYPLSAPERIRLLTDAGSFEQLFRCRLNSAMTLDAMSALLVVTSKPSSDLPGAVDGGGSSGGSPSSTLYFTEISGSGGR